MSSGRLGGDDDPWMYEEGDGDELFGESSSVSGGESDDDEEEEGRFSEGGAEASAAEDQMEHRRFAPQPQPLCRLNSNSVPQLSARKGLSRYYEGKSQSFACMSQVRCLDDLRKKEKPYQQHKIKSCKSYATLGGVGGAKAPSSTSCANLSLMAAATGFRTPRIPVNKNA
ncbi:hypothetical protein GUJ93_ZPchr0010g8714 [Zizania palustris]|uniref:Uncharacterized protein n=1 Tax=Zizania palustris TaxID=103762 RepID=A0A8J5WBA8_ZIZPA|nr:hypothetical protein GUJ93_ZPchr0010g8714 [Zizania palustris]